MTNNLKQKVLLQAQDKKLVVQEKRYQVQAYQKIKNIKNKLIMI